MRHQDIDGGKKSSFPQAHCTAGALTRTDDHDATSEVRFERPATSGELEWAGANFDPGVSRRAARTILSCGAGCNALPRGSRSGSNCAPTIVQRRHSTAMRTAAFLCREVLRLGRSQQNRPAASMLRRLVAGRPRITPATRKETNAVR
jgi:hypothetical protein